MLQILDSNRASQKSFSKLKTFIFILGSLHSGDGGAQPPVVGLDLADKVANQVLQEETVTRCKMENLRLKMRH